MDLRAFVPRFECKAVTGISMPPFKGSMIRGALFSALRRDFCIDRRSPECAICQAHHACPVCALLATVDAESSRGAEVARPCTIEPPLETRTFYAPDDRLSFGVTLFGEAAELLPYVVLGVKSMGETGIGSRQVAPGRFTVERIEAADPISERFQEIFAKGSNLVRCPEMPVTHDAIMSAYPFSMPVAGVTLEFLTPARLIAGGALAKSISFPLLIRRLLRRLTDLTRTATGSHPGFDYETLLESSEDVRVAEDQTRWVDVPSWSSRQGRFTPIGGLMGEISFTGDLTPFVPWLVWGSVTHIGKDATKGGGWYRLRWQS